MMRMMIEFPYRVLTSIHLEPMHHHQYNRPYTPQSLHLSNHPASLARAVAKKKKLLLLLLVVVVVMVVELLLARVEHQCTWLGDVVVDVPPGIEVGNSRTVWQNESNNQCRYWKTNEGGSTTLPGRIDTLEISVESGNHYCHCVRRMQQEQRQRVHQR